MHIPILIILPIPTPKYLPFVYSLLPLPKSVQHWTVCGVQAGSIGGCGGIIYTCSATDWISQLNKRSFFENTQAVLNNLQNSLVSESSK